MQQQAHTISKRLALFFIVVSALGFASKGVFIKLAYGDHQRVDPVSLMTLRMLFSLPFYLLILAWVSRKRVVTLNSGRLLQVIALGLTGYYLASFLDLTGLMYIPVGLERMILYLYPSMVVVMSSLLYRKSVHKQVWKALALSYLGISLVFIASTGMGDNLVAGSMLVFASAFVFALFIIGSGAMMKHLGSVRFTAMSMTVSSMAILTHFLLSHPASSLFQLETDVYKLGAIIAIFSTVLPSFLMAAGLKRLGGETASIISGAGPVATLLMAAWLLDEKITALQLSGVFLVIAGVWIISSRKPVTEKAAN